jgi:ABC-type oligopeptide transport system substrate-binding subunit/DNA-binding SARP family transcriptional activator/AAA+ ATPase superfamily predicted ATPase
MNKDEQHITMTTLGVPCVEVDGQIKTISRRQVRALLYYLVCTRGSIAREQLCFLFWPDRAEDEARRNLSILLSHLRRAFHPIHLVETSTDNVILENDIFNLDLREFERLLELGGGDEIESLTKAVSLYRGHFLEGFSLPGCSEYESWLTLQRRRLEQDYLRALTTITLALQERREYDAAARYAQTYLAVDELSEHVHRILIELYIAMGDRNRAQKQFELCSKILERELGVRPLPETRMALEAALPADREFVRSGGRDESTTIPGDRLPLIGRDEELEILRHRLDRVRSGKGSFLLVSGEVGIGKSYLTRAFLREQAETVSIFSGECYPGDQQPPYQPILDALQPLIRQMNSPDSEPPDWSVTLSPFFPQLKLSGRNEMQDKLLETAPGTWFQGFFRAFTTLSGDSHPGVLYLEDLQWADSATRSFLVYLVRRLAETPMLVLGTFRSEDHKALRELRYNLSRAGSFHEMPLQGFDAQTTHAFLQLASGNVKFNAGIAQRLYEISGGNPFFLLELLRSQKIERINDPSLDWTAAELPETILQALNDRVRSLSPHARQVLEVCVVLSKELNFDLIRRIAGRSELETIDGLDELQQKQILYEQDGVYYFSHGILRPVVYQRMSTWRRRLLHKRAGLELEIEHPDDFVLLAWHFERADPALSDKALDYLIRAADRTRGMYAHQEAIGLYHRSLTLLQEKEEHARTARTWMKLGLVQQIAGDYQSAQKSYAAGFDMWQRPLSTPEAISPSRNGKSLRMAWREPTTLDPAYARDTTSAAIIDQLYRGLLELNPDLGLIPSIAERFEIDRSGCRYTFKLRKDVNWSDGTPVTADDFACAWKRVLDPKYASPNASRLYDIKGARAFAEGTLSDTKDVGIHTLDEHTLVVELEAPCSYFPYLLSHHATYPVPRHVLDGRDEHDFTTQPLSCGPFLLDTWNKGIDIRLIRNPTYHGQFGGNIEQVLLTTDMDWHASLAAYEEDQIDVLSATRAETTDLVRARSRNAQDYISAPAFLTTYLGFNLRQSPFGDPRVRRAFAHAIDRHEMASMVMQGFIFPAGAGLVPPGLPGATQAMGHAFDIERARELLCEAGYPEGSRFPSLRFLSFNGSEPRVEYICKRLKEDLGIDVHGETLEFGVLLRRLDALEVDMFLIGWLADFPDPITFLRDCPFMNWTGWSNPEYTSLITKASQSVDTNTHIRLCRQAEDMLIDESPIVPINYARHNLLVKPWVTRFSPPVMGAWFFKDVVITSH